MKRKFTHEQIVMATILVTGLSVLCCVGFLIYNVVINGVNMSI